MGVIMSSEAELLSVYAGILDIFQELKRTTSTIDVMRLYVRYLKLAVRLSTNYPIFQDTEARRGNCYTYAMGFKCPNIFWERYEELKYKQSMSFDVGIIGANGNRLRVLNDCTGALVDNFYVDCEALGIDVYDINFLEKPSHDGYKIYMYKSKVEFGDFHFVRRNIDGTLSHKNGIDGDVQKVNNLGNLNSCYKLVKAFEIVKPVIRERKINGK